MSWYICTILLLLLGIFPMAHSLSNDCPSSMCGHLEIEFPYSLQSSPKSCRTAGLSANLSCSSTNETIITLPSSESYRVTDIYDSEILVQTLPNVNDSWEEAILARPNVNGSWQKGIQALPNVNGSWQKGIQALPNVNGSIFNVSMTSFVMVNCTTELTKLINFQAYEMVAGPISSLSGVDHFVYVMESDVSMEKLPLCVVISSWMQTSILSPRVEDENTRTCSDCSYRGKNCGYNIGRDKRFCFLQHSHHGLHLPIKGTAIATTLMVFLIATLAVYCFFKKYSNEKRKRIRVEKFLATYKSTTLTRYSFANIKKITEKFKHKLGQGGFGSVYKGELKNGIPVAVKMLEASKSNGEDFINEVATIGQIHHVNVVRLLGFCSDGTNRALVYEFMPNESLEKFIFFEESKKKHELFSIEKLQEIATGIAHGINYLHQGCNQRILHFDIKPHNILLDYDFNPKISDFGLAKLCSRDESIVTISAARGTLGYIAPEVYSRNFGPVSHKSDVYSYGMLLLEMIGRRKNVDPTIENLSEVYFPEWIYNKLVHRTNLGLAMEMEGNEEILKKLAIIALWSIQWNPIERPSMTKVVQMLTTNLQSLEMPPTPFVPSYNQLSNVNVSTNREEILEV